MTEMLVLLKKRITSKTPTIGEKCPTLPPSDHYQCHHASLSVRGLALPLLYSQQCSSTQFLTPQCRNSSTRRLCLLWPLQSASGTNGMTANKLATVLAACQPVHSYIGKQPVWSYTKSTYGHYSCTTCTRPLLMPHGYHNFGTCVLQQSPRIGCFAERNKTT